MALIKEIRKEALNSQILSQLGGDATSLVSSYDFYVLTLTDGTALLVSYCYYTNLSKYTPYQSSPMYKVDSNTLTYEETIKCVDDADLLGLNWSLFTTDGKDLLCEFLNSESGFKGGNYTGWLDTDEVNPVNAPAILNGANCISLTKPSTSKYRSFCYVEFDSIEDLESALIIQEPIDDSVVDDSLTPTPTDTGGSTSPTPTDTGGSTSPTPTDSDAVEVKKKSKNILPLVGLAAIGLVLLNKKK